ncbi:MAG TPA: LytTR family transcriptional regulator DNA-binding domain-containing protein [Pyrinomonadaceae bacterium]|nr:LytTR family transcriptional regulator DNA-binding domain-containing protein [Pyrinomonadaceae bacterium]
MNEKITALIVDDEPLARKFIRRMLENDRSIEIVGECGNGKEAVAAVLEKKPDLVFLDIQMPEMDGFTMIETLGIENLPNIVFVTAYEQYAIRAFEIHALDYLLKPFDKSRFEKAMKHAREKLANRRQNQLEQKQIAALLENVKQKPRFLDRLVIKADGRIVFLKTEDIDWIQADDKYVHLHAGNKSHLVRQTLGAMEAQLDTQKFIRVHRSAIVNIGRIKELQPMFTGEHTIILENGTKLTLSRSYKNKLFELLGNPL